MPQKITLHLRPQAAFEMPYSEGYQLYSTLLQVMQEGDCAMAKHTHDSPINSISLGPPEGQKPPGGPHIRKLCPKRSPSAS